MADRVQFILDRMAPSFRDMEQFGVFSAQEVRSVVKRRTDFEYRLRRRQQTPADYYGYLKYELGLEQLRDARCRRQSHAQRSEEPELSKELIDKHRKLQTAFMRHISYVFERALR
jgi:U3 small nucleolar RNA-associated protein 6